MLLHILHMHFTYRSIAKNLRSYDWAMQKLRQRSLHPKNVANDLVKTSFRAYWLSGREVDRSEALHFYESF